MDCARFLHTLCNVLALQRKKKRFDSFLQNYLTLSDVKGNLTKEQLYSYTKGFDFLVCGSDQIWNLRCADCNEFYFLSFASNNTKKVAYAPSMGLSEFQKDEEKKIENLVRDFYAISVREPQGAEILSKLLNRDITVVCDPVLLLTAEEWRNIMQPCVIKEPYIFCYFIGNISGMRDFVALVKAQTGIKKVVVVIKNLRDIGSGYSSYFDAGPLEFLGLIDGASYIVTDSFHATCFSLLFHKKFWVFVEENDKTKPNSRISNILDKAQCPERMLNISTMYACKVKADIDFEKSDKALHDFSEDSKKYILNVFI